ncbi:MAG: 16S rRNA (uracil(1498)-N(3))-methyltransferase [Erysipelotrichales bacterium]|nr:16S rRNA (uracil(1498)-N(3))-methyltransferase [Erysipelotrichales bacterium]
MQRYFVTGDIDNISFTEGDIFHIQKVMRFKSGDLIEIVLSSKVYLTKIENVNPLKVEIIEELEEKRELENDITLLYCLPKGDKLDLVIQKATELGVKNIVGVISSRTIVKIDEKDKKRKIERFNKIIKEAAEQSKRVNLPEFIDIIDFKDICKYLSIHNFIAYEGEALNDGTLFDDLNKIKKNESISILVGAEGGFSLSEVKLANEIGFKSVSLGKLILRSETAAIYFLSVLSFMLSR